MKYWLVGKNGVSCLLTYREGSLQGIDFQDIETTPEMFNITRFVFYESDLGENAKKYGWKVEIYEEFEISFEYFWEKYNYKVDKKRAEDKWKRLKPEEQRKAIAYIPVYLAELRKTGVAQMYAKTYLHNKVWEV
ncbi:MAG: hypothetical protein NZ551_07515 [Microscillaceae bacterium]|nr:hypothetical protein [Microscillaceae bacterium]MDW8461043.1 hypothetical protein [Cytophagales bacterium]